MTEINNIYRKYSNTFTIIADILDRTDLNSFTEEENQITETTVLLVGLL